jgi:hypothetical protein
MEAPSSVGILPLRRSTALAVTTRHTQTGIRIIVTTARAGERCPDQDHKRTNTYHGARTTPCSCFYFYSSSRDLPTANASERYPRSAGIGGKIRDSDCTEEKNGWGGWAIFFPGFLPPSREESCFFSRFFISEIRIYSVLLYLFLSFFLCNGDGNRGNIDDGDGVVLSSMSMMMRAQRVLLWAVRRIFTLRW